MKEIKCTTRESVHVNKWVNYLEHCQYCFEYEDCQLKDSFSLNDRLNKKEKQYVYGIWIAMLLLLSIMLIKLFL